MTSPLDTVTFRRLLLHEARVHAGPGRHLRELDDAILLHDPNDPEPFWNRLEALRWPADQDGFDRRLGESAVLFAALGRQPHIWVSPSHDEPRDLTARLRANGFEDMGPGHLMVVRDADPARGALRGPMPTGFALERLANLHPPAALPAAQDIVDVLLPAFEVEKERQAGILAETLATLADRRFAHYLGRLHGSPVAVARRATFDGLSYLSSIATLESARGQGFGRLVTAMATVDAIEAASEWVHLGVFEGNDPAIRMYERLGYWFSGEPGPDMVLVG